MSPTPLRPTPQNVRTTRQPPRGVLQVDWPFFGELCRALALKIFRDYDPELVIGIAKAGAIPGSVVASILQRDHGTPDGPRLADPDHELRVRSEEHTSELQSRPHLV